MICPLLVSVLSLVVSPCLQEEIQMTRHELINFINTNQSNWTAGDNFPEITSTEVLKRLNGVLGIDPDPEYQVTLRRHKIGKTKMPEFFDARDAWAECSGVIGYVRDQGQCGSCWAFAAAEVMSDRLCIATGGQDKVMLSPEDLLQCCTDCGLGCDGGYVNKAWEYWLTYGVVSGGDYNSNTGCKPYSALAYLYKTTPPCQKRCQLNYNTPYEVDKSFALSIYKVSSEEEQIQMEIMTNGPVMTTYTVFEDFYSYQRGVYHHVAGKYMGQHAVKIIGWGVENKIPYWIVANSWGSRWGALGGFFKILRGVNHCGIEEYVIVSDKSHSSQMLPLPLLIVTLPLVCKVIIFFAKF
uniref:C1 family cathepsin B23 n=1 Tax=Tenebrio molitor TaxID=7067 RepID=A0A0B5J1Y4_TENMO|nr:C1 family cathepsin B23 [Tenebrio molitor]